MAVDLARYAKRRAVKKEMDFDLDAEWVYERLIIGRCEATGVWFDLSPTKEKGKKRRLAPSIDRRDPKKGYTKDNCQVVIFHYNMAKWRFGEEELVELAKAILGVENGS